MIRKWKKLRQDYGFDNNPEMQNLNNINYHANPGEFMKGKVDKVTQPNLPNYGIKPSYRNQSTILLADASSTNNKNIELKKDYVPFIKNKPLTTNPYSTKNYNFGESSLSNNPITNPIGGNSYASGKNYSRISSNIIN